MKQNISKIRQNIYFLRLDRKILEDNAMRIRGKMIHGTLLRRYTYCGKKGCKCSKGEPHGPFYYLSQKIEGKTKYTYVKDKYWIAFKERVDNYNRFWKHLSKIEEINKRIRNLFLKIWKIKTDTVKKIKKEV